MILYRYFAKEIFVTMLSVASVVLVISMGWRFSGYLNEAARGVISSDVLFLIMAYRLPGFLELIAPVSFFLAIMLTYGRLHVDSEMVILETSGLSPAKLMTMTIVLSLVVMAGTASITLWLKPLGEKKVETLLKAQRDLTEFDTLAPGRFQTLRSGKRVTYTESFSDSGELKNVFINEYKVSNAHGAKDVVTLVAESGENVVDETGNRFILLKNGMRYSGVPGSPGYQVIKYDQYGQLVARAKAPAMNRRRAAIPTLELFSMETLAHVSELHWRISIILMIPIIAVMAIPLSRVNPRQGRFTRLVPGLILCFLYVICLSAGRGAIEKSQLPKEAGLWWIHGIFVVVAIGLYQLDKVTAPFRFLASMFKRKPKVGTS